MTGYFPAISEIVTDSSLPDSYFLHEGQFLGKKMKEVGYIHSSNNSVVDYLKDLGIPVKAVFFENYDANMGYDSIKKKLGESVMNGSDLDLLEECLIRPFVLERWNL